MEIIGWGEVLLEEVLEVRICHETDLGNIPMFLSFNFHLT